MQKILHLYRVDKFTNGFIEFINHNFKDDYHELWIYGKNGYGFRMPNCRNAVRIRDILEKLKGEKIHDFDKIIYHGVFEKDIISFFYSHKRLLKKIYLYFWGGDKYFGENRWLNLKKYYLVHNAAGIINVLSEEYPFMRKRYKFTGKWFEAKYHDLNLFRAIEDARQDKEEQKDYIAIQLGNSATQTNEHFKILKLLERFKEEKIKIFAPLSYGDAKYAEQVISYGKKMFDEKFVAITDFMEQNKYYSFMNKMDIAIFGMRRQQAGGNIYAHLVFGKKVYVQENSILHNYYGKRFHCEIGMIQSISNMTFEEFITFSKNAGERNRINIEKEYLNKEARIEEWNNIFSYNNI